MIIISKDKKIEVEDFDPRTHKFDFIESRVVELTPREKEIFLREEKEAEYKMNRIGELKKILSSCTEDFAQVAAGFYIPDIEERKQRFIVAHNELRQLEGKDLRNTR